METLNIITMRVVALTEVSKIDCKPTKLSFELHFCFRDVRLLKSTRELWISTFYSNDDHIRLCWLRFT